ncbi:NAD(P)-binding protein [Polychaeton citri CBS 116435]|uniref:NAD(P)-binding protein n=1 Tax=Polychaeton citri CBS 116435 TaxID=1314669 RepID=A0A9P4QCX0_9PEZI|nr:NAD(P)-binding protein [Polychaeton citri CBS 116435]
MSTPAAPPRPQLPPFHRSTYPAISPLQNAALAKTLTGKRILITGGGSGIGAAIAKAFANTEPATIVLCGRRLDALEATKSSILNSNTIKSKAVQVVTLSVDVTREDQVESVFQQAREAVGPLDVCISCAGFFGENGERVVDDASEQIWKAFEVNVKGSMLVARHFFKNATQDAEGGDGASQPVLISINAGLGHLPPPLVAGPMASSTPGYSASKMGLAKLMEWVAVDVQGRGRVYSVHPGIVKSDLADRLVGTAANPEQLKAAVTFDDAELPADFCVWLASTEGKCIPSGKYLWCNWDVDALKEQSSQIYRNPFMHTTGLLGLELFGFGADPH